MTTTESVGGSDFPVYDAEFYLSYRMADFEFVVLGIWREGVS